MNERMKQRKKERKKEKQTIMNEWMNERTNERTKEKQATKKKESKKSINKTKQQNKKERKKNVRECRWLSSLSWWYPTGRAEPYLDFRRTNKQDLTYLKRNEAPLAQQHSEAHWYTRVTQKILESNVFWFKREGRVWAVKSGIECKFESDTLTQTLHFSNVHSGPRDSLHDPLKNLSHLM